MATANPNNGTIPFENILNFRDVGQHINHLTSHPLLNPGLLYRSARPDAASPPDRQNLTSTLNIKTILDLRTPTEHLEARRKEFSTSQPTISAPGLAPKDRPQQALRIAGMRYRDVNLNGDGYSNALLKQLSWRQTAKLYGLYVVGYRKEAIAVLASNVMTPRGLSGLAIDTLTYSKADIAGIFTSTLADPASYPVLVHCTQGKDRTGLIILLILLLCGADTEAIEADYMASQTGLEPEREAKVQEVRSIGLADSFADCESGWVGRVVEWIEGQGGVEGYLEGCGVGRDVQEKVKGVLMVG